MAKRKPQVEPATLFVAEHCTSHYPVQRWEILARVRPNASASVVEHRLGEYVGKRRNGHTNFTHYRVVPYRRDGSVKPTVEIDAGSKDLQATL